MKKTGTILCLMLIIVLLTGCGPVSIASEEPPAPIEVDVEDNGSKEGLPAGETEDNNPEEPSLHEWTEEEKALLEIDYDKIIFAVFDYEKWKTDDVGLLLSRFPEAVLVSREYVDKDRLGEDRRHEIWRINPVGLTYYVYFYVNRNEINGKSNVPMNRIQRITGSADGLITGLIAPIAADELIKLLGIPENAWAEKRWPESPGFEHYEYSSPTPLDSEIDDMVYIVIPDPNNEREAIGIEIQTSKPGFISPEDELTLRDVIARV